MQNRNEEAIKILEKLEVELEFLTSVIEYVGTDHIELNSSDMLGFSSFLARIKNDIQKSMDVLS